MNSELEGAEELQRDLVFMKEFIFLLRVCIAAKRGEARRVAAGECLSLPLPQKLIVSQLKDTLCTFPCSLWLVVGRPLAEVCQRSGASNGADGKIVSSEIRRAQYNSIK